MMDGRLDCDQLEFTPSHSATVEQQLCGYFEMRYKQELKRAGQKVKELMNQGLSFSSEIWNERVQQDMVNVGVYYGDYLLCRNFLRYLEGENFFTIRTPLRERGESLNVVMAALYRNFAFHLLFDETQSFLRNFTPEVLKFFRDKQPEYKSQFKGELFRLALSALDISEGWDIDDQEFMSILAKKDETEEQMYTGMLNHMRKNPINQKPVLKGFNSTIRPFLMNPKL